MTSAIPILIILGLIVLNAFFVMAEFAVVGAPRPLIEKPASPGQRAAAKVSRILHDPRLQDRYFATAQLGITLASLGLGMYGEHSLAEWIAGWLGSLDTTAWLASHTVASLIAVGILAYLHIVFGEMMPKSFALQQPERASSWIMPLMIGVEALLYPLVITLNAIGNGILRLMNVKRQLTTGHFLTAEELQYIVAESEAGGLLRGEAGRVFRDLLEFGDLTAAEVMVPRVRIVGVPLDSSRDELRDIVLDSRHSRYPVYDGDMDHILGMVHIKDLLRFLLEGRQQLTRGDLRPVPYVPETSPLDAVLPAMRRRRTHLAIIMDEYGGTAGLITIEDLFGEVVGDIDEDNAKSPEGYRDSLDVIHVAGTVRIEEVGELFGLTLEHEEVYTVSGLVLMLLNRRPIVGDSVVYQNVRFEVTAIKGHGVGECVVTVEPPAPQETSE